MKKSLVLAMAMALGVTASAYAANPFSDVPAGHWAYDSIDKLAAAGVIEGMGDGSYQGDRTMTRYEMAQIVAKAMAKGCNVDKLAAEFADELDALGVRVAALEKKADNVTITGQIRYENGDYREGGYKWNKTTNMFETKGHNSTHRLRTRLFLNGQINEDWAYHARIENNMNFNDTNGADNLTMNQAWVTGKLGGLKVSAGRTPVAMGQSFVLDDQLDGAVVEYGKNVKVKAWAGDVNDASDNTADGHIFGAEVATKLGIVDASVGYNHYELGRYGNTAKIADVALAAPIAKNVKLSGLYIYAAEQNQVADNDGFTVGLNYKGAKASQVGSWGLSAKYYRVGAYNWIVAADKIDDCTDYYIDEGFKGWAVGANYTVAKNMVASIDYADVDGRVSDDKTKQVWYRLQMTF